MNRRTLLSAAVAGIGSIGLTQLTNAAAPKANKQKGKSLAVTALKNPAAFAAKDKPFVVLGRGFEGKSVVTFKADFAVTVKKTVFVSHEALFMYVDVAKGPEAPLVYWADLTVTNPNGDAATLERALEVLGQ